MMFGLVLGSGGQQYTIVRLNGNLNYAFLVETLDNFSSVLDSTFTYPSRKSPV